MKNYVVEVWEPIPNGEQTPQEKEWKLNHRVTNQEGFVTLLDAWNWVIDNHVGKYTVYNTECVIDNS